MTSHNLKWMSAAIPLGLAGCDGATPQSVKQIEQAHAAYRAQRYDDTERLATQVAARAPDSPTAAEALYLRGLARLARGRKSEARNDFQAGLDRARRKDLVGLLHAQLGTMDYDAGAYARAADHFRAAESELPDRPPSDEMLVRYGVSLQRIGRMDEARRVFGRVVARYGNRPAGEEARRKLDWKRDYFSIQCGAFSQEKLAYEAVQRLRTQGVSAEVDTGYGASNYIVLAGRYRTYDDASGALPAVRRAASDAFIVP